MDIGLLIAALLLFAALHVSLGYLLARWLDRSRRVVLARDALEAERVRGVLKWLSETTGDVEGDLGRHRRRMEEINRALGDAEAKSTASLTNVVIEVVGEMVAANQRLQNKLTSTEIQLQQQRLQLETQTSRAMTDGLTSLPNRRALDDELARQFALWLCNGTPFSLILLDLDHFKQLNDTHGHAAGDEALRRVARLLRETLRTCDLVGRYGGEEFAVILPETDAAGAIAAAEMAVRAIAAVSIEFDGTPLKVTASAGAATVSAADESPLVLTHRADQALYASKQGGRNQGHFHDGEQCVPLAGDNDPPGGSASSSAPSPRRLSRPTGGDLKQACDNLRDHAAGILSH